MATQTVTVTRAPVLTLRAAVVAGRKAHASGRRVGGE
jgi:hypothetical protein